MKYETLSSYSGTVGTWGPGEVIDRLNSKPVKDLVKAGILKPLAKKRSRATTPDTRERAVTE